MNRLSPRANALLLLHIFDENSASGRAARLAAQDVLGFSSTSSTGNLEILLEQAEEACEGFLRCYRDPDPVEHDGLYFHLGGLAMIAGYVYAANAEGEDDDVPS